MKYRLKELRESEKLTQQELANDLGLNSVTYSNYENENREPPIETLIKIADYYGVSLDYLLKRNTNIKFYYITNDQKEKAICELAKRLNPESKDRVIGYITCLLNE